MTPEQTTMVNISLEKYRDLILKEALLGAMLQASYSQAHLSYDQKKLSLDDDSLESLLRIMDSERYWGIHRTLVKSKEATDGTNKN